MTYYINYVIYIWEEGGEVQWEGVAPQIRLSVPPRLV